MRITKEGNIRACVTLLILALFIAPIGVRAQVESRTLYSFWVYNCSMHGDVNELFNEFVVNKEVVLEVSPFVGDNWASYTSIGIGVLILAFNRSLAPDIKSGVSITLNNESAIDMLINYTYEPNGYMRERTGGSVIECTWFMAYVYLFENHTVLNAGHIDVSNAFNDDGVSIVPDYEPASLGSVPDDDIELRMSFTDPVNTTSTTSTTYEPDYESIIVIEALMAFSMLLFACVVLTQRRK